MEEVFIDIRKENKQIKELFPNKDFASIYELVGKLEELVDEVENLKRERIELENEYKFVPRDPDYTRGDY